MTPETLVAPLLDRLLVAGLCALVATFACLVVASLLSRRRC
jgi:hypothetical protein